MKPKFTAIHSLPATPVAWLVLACTSLISLSQAGTTLTIQPPKPIPSYTKTNLMENTAGRDIVPSFAVADFNQDGRPDVAIVTVRYGNRAGSDLGVGVFVQNPAGAFAKAGETQINQLSDTPFLGPDVSMISGDFNEDGRVDLLVSDYPATQDVVLLIGDGKGGFQAPRHLGAAMLQPFIAVSDINGDGHIDLLLDGMDGGVEVWLGQGDGTFHPGPKLATSGSAEAILPGDVNGDGRNDVVVSTLSPGGQSRNAEVFLANAQGSFQAPIVTELAIPGSPYAALADVNLDGKADYVFVNQPANSIEVWFGNGQGQFAKAGSYPAGVKPGQFTISDLNGDGIPDLLIGSDNLTLTEMPLSVLLGRGNGSFEPRQLYNLDTGSVAQSPVVVDFDGDGRPDLMAVALHGDALNTLHIARNAGTGSLSNTGFLLNVKTSEASSNVVLVLEASEDCVHWSPMATNVPVALWPVVETSTAARQRFFRTRMP